MDFVFVIVEIKLIDYHNYSFFANQNFYSAYPDENELILKDGFKFVP